MPTEAAERRTVRAQQMGAPLPPVEQHDPLPCPRCSSLNTKFCYYNNYNFSQPRHFCKSCRRYWTHGGTLRDIPVGGGSRKTAKRSRTSSPLANSITTTTTTSGGPIPVSQAPAYVSLPSTTAAGGGFTSLLSGGGILAVGGFGLGLDDVGFGFGRGVWAFPHHEVGSYVNGGGCTGVGGGEGGGGLNRNDTWQVESGEVVGFVSGECFSSLPELAISSSGNGLK